MKLDKGLFSLKMGNFKARVIVQCVLLLSVIYSVNGLTCYECTSTDGALCGDPLNKTVAKLVDCSKSVFTQFNLENEQFICISSTERNSTNTVHTRRCALSSESNICDKIKEGGYNLTSCHVCQQDLCNSSIMLKDSSLPTVLVLVSCLLIFIKPNL